MLSKKKDSKGRLADESSVTNKTFSNRFSPERDNNASQRITKKEGSDSKFRAIRPRLEANIAHRDSTKITKKSQQKQQTVIKDLPTNASEKVDDVNEVPEGEETAAEQVETLTSQANKLKTEIEMLLKKKRELEEQSVQRSAEKENTVRSMNNLLDQNRDLLEENGALKEQVRDDHQELMMLRKKVADLETNIKKLRDENRILNESNLKMFKQLEEAGAEKRDMDKTVDEKHKLVEKLSKEKTRADNLAQAAEMKASKLKSDLFQLNKQLEEMRNDTERCKSTIKELKTEVHHLKTALKASVTNKKK